MHGLPLVYSIRRMRRQVNTGCTRPVFGELNAVFKFDDIESPNCVYNEYVAKTLANKLCIPVADGVLVASLDGPIYASLEVSAPGIPLPDLHKPSINKLAKTYPDSLAALLAFDLWIGNKDRLGNVKAALVSDHISLFVGFDHSHALLNIETSPMKSIRRLREGDTIIEGHPFIRYTEPGQLLTWLNRICELPELYIDNCCRMGRPFRNVSERLQAGLANALKQRRENFMPICEKLGYLIEIDV